MDYAGGVEAASTKHKNSKLRTYRNRRYNAQVFVIIQRKIVHRFVTVDLLGISMLLVFPEYY